MNELQATVRPRRRMMNERCWRAATIIAVLWTLTSARLVWVAIHATTSYCLFGRCGERHSTPWSVGELVSSAGAVTVAALVLFGLLWIWLRPSDDGR